MNWQPIITFGLFGLWTLFCVACGAWLACRARDRLSPLPGLPDNFSAAKMFQWLRGGKNKEPPLEDEPEQKPAGYQL